MRRLVVAAMTAALVSALLPAVALSGQEKVPVCHLNDTGGFQLIEVAEPAYESHLAHGDGGIHEPVPGQPGYVFDADCEPLPILVRITTLDANGKQHLLVQWEDTNADAVPSVGDTIRTGEFPSFTGPRTWDYVTAARTEFLVTAVDTAWRYDGPIPEFADNFGISAWNGAHANFRFAQKYADYAYYEERYGLANVYASRVWDTSDPYKWYHDYTAICGASPSLPGPYPPTPSCPPQTHGDWTNDLIQIALYWG